MELDNNIEKIRSQERFFEIQKTLSMVCGAMAIPLYLVFWVCDLLYAPEHKWTFLGFRILTAIGVFAVYLLKDRVKTLEQAFSLSLFLAFFLSFFITVMVVMTDGASSPYYAGLNLVAVGILSFLPWTNKLFVFVVGLIYGPFYLGSLMVGTSLNDLKQLGVSSFFVVGTIVVCLVIRFFNEKIKRKEIESRVALQNEIENRNKIIRKRTDQAIRLKSLSAQFSPQVVHSIKEGQIDLQDYIHDSHVCAIFVDIVNSTQKVNQIDKKSMDSVIKMFMEDTMKVLLKYDITIDKFLGDGVLAFCNDPIKHTDYIERTVHAAVEIKERIAQRQNQYKSFWLNHLEICVGVAVGEANVGFYGSEQYFKSYTAIGPVVNLASRLCSQADANQILVSSEVVDHLVGQKSFEFKSLGRVKLKGFNEMTAYEAIGVEEIVSEEGVSECPACPQEILYLDSSSGIFVLKCRSCGYVLDGDRQDVIGPVSEPAAA